MNYKTGTVRAKDINLDEVDFAVDTALSWDGKFPKPGKGDYLVAIGHINGEPQSVLVSRRYTSPGLRETERRANEIFPQYDVRNAAGIALDAFAERHSYERDDEGRILEVAIEGLGTGIPCWVERVDRVTR